MGEVFFTSREKEGFSFFDLVEYKKPFRNSLKYFGVEVRKSLFSPAKNLKIFFLNLYFFRKLESLRKVHSTFWFNKVNEWWGRFLINRSPVKKVLNGLLIKKKSADFLRRRGLKNKYIRDMRISRKRLKKSKKLIKYGRKNQRMIMRRWEGVYSLRRKQLGRKEINIGLWDWINNFKKFWYVGENLFKEQLKKVYLKKLFKQKLESIDEEGTLFKRKIKKVKKINVRGIKKIKKSSKNQKWKQFSKKDLLSVKKRGRGSFILFSKLSAWNKRKALKLFRKSVGEVRRRRKKRRKKKESFSDYEYEKYMFMSERVFLLKRLCLSEDFFMRV